MPCQLDVCVTTQKSHRVFGYARVSTLEQDPALQHDALAAVGVGVGVGVGVDKVFTDQVSGTTTSRPELDRVLVLDPEKLRGVPR